MSDLKTAFFPQELYQYLLDNRVDLILEPPHEKLRCCGAELDHALGCYKRAMLHPSEVDWTSRQALRWYTRQFFNLHDGAWWCRWRGHRVAKMPTDLWMYQEILHETRPELIIETGTWEGGSAMYLADVCEAMRHGKVVSVDIKPIATPPHPRILYFTGASSTDPRIVADLAEGAREARTMVILDSAHDYTHVSAELEAYAPLVSPDCYLIVEDTDMFDTMMAVEHWLPQHPEFEVDMTREIFGLTKNPGSYLRRRKADS